MRSSNLMGASPANVAPHACRPALSGGDLLGLFFANPLLPALLVALGPRLLQGLPLLAFGFLLAAGPDRYHLLASSSVYSRSSSGPPTTSAPKSSATRKNLPSDSFLVYISPPPRGRTKATGTAFSALKTERSSSSTTPPHASTDPTA